MKTRQQKEKPTATVRMTIRFAKPKLLAQLIQLAHRDNRKPSDYVRNVLRAHVERVAPAAPQPNS